MKAVHFRPAGLLAALFLLGSCSTYDRLAVWYKYRGEYRVHAVETERLAATGRAGQAVASEDAMQPGVQALAAANAGGVGIVERLPSAEVQGLAKALKAGPRVTKPEARVTDAPTRPTVRQLLKAKRILKGQQAQSGDSQIIALVCCASILIGLVGIHRFYLGYIWQGVVQLLTFGGCGIWWLIDVIRICTGDLKPNGGRYTETLN